MPGLISFSSEPTSSVRRQAINPINPDSLQAGDEAENSDQAPTPRPRINTEPVVRPANRNPVPDTPVRKPKEKKSLTDALSRIRSSIDEFNDSNPQGAQ